MNDTALMTTRRRTDAATRSFTQESSARTSSNPCQGSPGPRMQQPLSPRAAAETCAGVFESKEPPSNHEALAELTHPTRARLATARQRATLPVFSTRILQGPFPLTEKRSIRLEPVIAAEPMALPGSAQQDLSLVPDLAKQPLAFPVGQPVQPDVVRDLQYVCNQIAKAFATAHCASAWHSPLHESGGHARLANLCEGLVKMIDRLVESGQKARAYGQLTLQLANYGGADGSLAFNQDRYAAARAAIEQIAEKLHNLQGDVTSVIIWSNVNNLMLELRGLSSGKVIVKSLVGASDALQKTLRMSPKDADQHIKAVLAAQVHSRR